MSHSNGPHHNILTTASSTVNPHSFETIPAQSRNDGGYTLVALLALMTVLALFAAAAAPSLQQQMRREKELETIFRGEQVAEAIRRYYAYNQTRMPQGDAALPTSIDQLLEGVSVGTKKVQILRSFAARDPLTPSGEWQLVAPRSTQLADFQRSVMLFAADVRPPTTDPQLKQVELLMAPPVLPTLNTGSASLPTSSVDDFKGPFIGVSSKSKNNSVIYYYGIDREGGWVFTPLFR